MAEIRPLRAWRYKPGLNQSIQDLTSPLFDVVSDKQRETLYNEEYNSIHLSVPKGDHHPKLLAKETLKKWKEEGVIVQDNIPGIYVYYQYFTLSGSDKEFCRKGFICNIRLHEWEDKVILRHESTMPHSVNDRKEILHETQLNVSPTHGLYTDELHQIEPYLDESMKAPIYEVEDYQGVKDVLSVIHDAAIIKKIIGILKNKQVILADGHHRYESAIQYRREQMDHPEHTGEEGYNFQMMYLTNTDS